MSSVELIRRPQASGPCVNASRVTYVLRVQISPVRTASLEASHLLSSLHIPAVAEVSSLYTLE